jgi:hypothetical protein
MDILIQGGSTMWNQNVGACRDHSDYEYLRQRVEELEDRERRRSEERQRAWEDGMRERRSRLREAEREASSWEEAFQKQRILVRQELRCSEEAIGQPPDPVLDRWFLEDVAGLRTELAGMDTAESIYRDEVHAAEVEAQRIVEEARRRAAERIAAEVPGGGRGFISTLVECLRDGAEPTVWLDW